MIIFLVRIFKIKNVIFPNLWQKTGSNVIIARKMAAKNTINAPLISLVNLYIVKSVTLYHPIMEMSVLLAIQVSCFKGKKKMLARFDATSIIKPPKKHYLYHYI